MEKAIFLGQQASTDLVYSDSTTKCLFETLTFPLGKHAVTKEELPKLRETLLDIRYIFSTWGMYDLTVEEIRHFFPSLRAVFYAAGSVQHFARSFLACGVAVHSAWAANAVPVAEYTFSQIVLANSGFFRRLHIPSSGSAWKNRVSDLPFPGNYEATVGIIGAGMIGKMVIERIHAALEKMRILVFDPFLPEETAKSLGVTLCDLPTLFTESDVISNHLANNPQTVGMLNGDLFSRMKPYATFINTGRGAQVIEKDLIAALTEVPTRAAVLDVTIHEPPLSDSPFYGMANVFLTPHIAGSLGNEVHRMAEYMLAEYRRLAAHEPTRFSVSLKMLETMA